ncbi:hypothetical protein LSA03_11430 [Pediococcus argentinicus]|nr:hypothetical protein LSA03_11430 [Pediococcus argentinicus]
MIGIIVVVVIGILATVFNSDAVMYFLAGIYRNIRESGVGLGTWIKSLFIKINHK